MEKCRACLTIGCALISIDEEFVHNYNILTNLDVKTSDDLTQLVCETCLRSVKFFIAFREKCILSEGILMGICEDSKLTKIKQDEEVIKTEYESDHNDSYLEPLKYVNDINVMDNAFEQLTDIKINIKKFKRKRNVKQKVKDIDLKHKKKKEPKCKKKVMGPLQSSREQSYLCGLCPKEMVDNEALLHHLEAHKVSMDCNLCPKVARQWAQLLAHRIAHVPSDQKCCHICLKRYQHIDYLEYHYRKIHFDEKNIILDCEWCTRTFNTPRSLSKHVWGLHSDKTFVCDQCGKMYNNKQRLAVHVRAHMQNRAFACDLCDFTCKLPGGLRDHKIRRHEPSKVYCGQCKRPFESQAKYEGHKCGRQPGKICPVCGLQLRPGHSLSRHMASHEPEGRYQCPRCPKRYKGRGGLRVHLNMHDGHRAHRCEHCAAAFYHPTSLVKHRRIHTGEKPYKCKICGRGFTGNNNLKVHMRVHGEYNLIVKRVKPEEVVSQTQLLT